MINTAGCQREIGSRVRSALRIVAIFALAAACARPQGSQVSPVSFRARVAGIDWELYELHGSVAPLGAGGRRATIMFDADTARMELEQRLAAALGAIRRYQITERELTLSNDAGAVAKFVRPAP